MCGVVSYFGDEPGGISRIITGMSAIIYRAPDSTGIGMFGDLTEPVAMRKCLGSVVNMMEVFLHASFDNSSCRIMTALTEQDQTIASVQMQHRLIAFEDLSLSPETKSRRANTYPNHHEIKEMCRSHGITGLLGRIGRTGVLPVFTIRSRNDFRAMIRTLLLDYNLSAVAVKSLIQNRISHQFDLLNSETHLSKSGGDTASDCWKVSKTDIYGAFDYLFQKTIEELRPVSESHRDRLGGHGNPHAKRILWRLISSMTVTIPADFDRDGVRYLFRIIDGSILCHLSRHPDIMTGLQKRLNQQMRSGVDWLSLYASERALNVFGRAAASALDWACDHRKRLLDMPPAFYRNIRKQTSPGRKNYKVSSQSTSDQFCGILDYLAQPIIGHGRWALQSSVTVKNAHPFTDASMQRLIALNGQFSADVEDEMHTFLTQVAGISPRTDNSGEYLSLFWGYYFESLIHEKQRFQEIQQQIEMNLDTYGAGNNTINYRIFKELKDRNIREIDEMAFIKATTLFIRKGGQIAVTGISMVSPETLYAAASNRPLFVVKRVDRDDYMIVSDINAALGLFSQKEILTVTRAYDLLVSQRDGELKKLEFSQDLKEQWEARINRYDAAIASALDRLKVEVYAMEGRDLFAKIETGCSPENAVFRTLSFTDFKGNQVHDIEAERLNLTPPHVHKNLNESFFESHMQQIPELLKGLCDAVFNDKNISLNPIQLNRNALERRFGKNLGGLKRIVLSGMGTSFHTCISCAAFMRRQLPDIEIITLKPVTVTYLSRRISSEQDLVLLVSWSGTTADMVDFAKKLHQAGVLCIGVTEKTVGDLALITRKSGGIIYTMSGEEVTVPAVKSTFCVAMVLNLFALWFRQNLKKELISPAAVRELMRIPEMLAQVLGDASMTRTIESMAFAHAGQKSMLVIGDLKASAVDMDAALKLEEMSWILKARSVDYSQIPKALLQGQWVNTQVLVNATHPWNMDRVLAAMGQLNRAGIKFVTLTWEGRELEDIQRLSEQVLVVPRIPGTLQHFIDLIFYYQLAFFSGRARGRMDDDFPRNRAKSVTTSRSVPPVAFAPRNELFTLYHRETLFAQPPDAFVNWNRQTPWEKLDHSVLTLETIRHLKQIGQSLQADDPGGCFMKSADIAVQDMASMLFNGDGIDHICFQPLDLQSRSAVQKTISVLERFFPCTLRCARPNENSQGMRGRILILHVSACSTTRPHDRWRRKEHLHQRFLCPASSKNDISPSDDGIPEINFQENFQRRDDCLIYATLMVLLVAAWKKQDPDGSDLVMGHFQRSAFFLDNVLSNTAFADQIRQVTRRNRAYGSLLYLSPADGSGISFIRRFDAASCCFAVWQSFGNSAHGPLVTVDSDVDSKYILMESREKMTARYGKKNICQWEEKYLEGMDVDSFLARRPEKLENIINTPFYTQGSWYLPLLRPDYDPSGDNLVILDAASEFYFEQAIDDLTVFGSRHARMILISQEALINTPEKRALKKYPLSGAILIPSLAGKDRPVPLSHCHLPFVMVLISSVMADIYSE